MLLKKDPIKKVFRIIFRYFEKFRTAAAEQIYNEKRLR